MGALDLGGSSLEVSFTAPSMEGASDRGAQRQVAAAILPSNQLLPPRGWPTMSAKGVVAEWDAFVLHALPQST